MYQFFPEPASVAFHNTPRRVGGIHTDTNGADPAVRSSSSTGLELDKGSTSATFRRVHTASGKHHVAIAHSPNSGVPMWQNQGAHQGTPGQSLWGESSPWALTNGCFCGPRSLHTDSESDSCSPKSGPVIQHPSIPRHGHSSGVWGTLPHYYSDRHVLATNPSLFDIGILRTSENAIFCKIFMQKSGPHTAHGGNFTYHWFCFKVCPTWTKFHVFFGKRISYLNSA